MQTHSSNVSTVLESRDLTVYVAQFIETLVLQYALNVFESLLND